MSTQLEAPWVPLRKTAILVDGGFYRHRARSLFGKKDGQSRADELIAYCLKHISHSGQYERRDLYRIYFYDSFPVESKLIFHPFLNKTIDLKNSQTTTWAKDFFTALTTKRKLALRRGELDVSHAHYSLDPKVLKQLCRGEKSWNDLCERDFKVAGIKQKGVDMRIGLDVANLADGPKVDQIILIAGDSDLVPALKLARKAGIDVILDPMLLGIRDSLKEHVDGIQSVVSSFIPKT